MHKTNFLLRAARPDESGRLLDFYQNNPSQFLIPRPKDEFKTAVEKGNYFLLENTREIVAATGIFDYERNLPFVELAETIVTKPVQGFGLQSLFIRLRVASVIIFQGPDIGITTAVDPKNPDSLKNITNQGFQNWSPVPAALSSCPSCRNKTSDRPCCCDYFSLPQDRVKAAVACLLRETEKGSIILENKKKDRLTFKFTCALLFGEYRAGLEEFVAGMNW